MVDMAKTTTVSITDDIDGSANARSVDFSYRGAAYTIDLGKKNAAALDKLLKPYLDAATKVLTRGRPAAAPARSRRTASKPTASADVAAIRAWAAQNGHAVNARGRISQTVRDAYNAAKK
jgi:hypothetical protein